MQLTVRMIEKKAQKKVKELNVFDDSDDDVIGVASLRCDTAGENGR